MEKLSSFRLLDGILNTALALKKGQGVLIGDQTHRENEIDFVFAAGAATESLVSQALWARGLLCVAMGHKWADNLGLALLGQFPANRSHTAFMVPVDAMDPPSSGISAAARSHTIALLGNSKSRWNNFITPGHVFPVRAAPGGILQRQGHTEAVADLCLLAGLEPVGAMCEILDAEGKTLPANTHGNRLPHPFQNCPMTSTEALFLARLLQEGSVLPSHERSHGVLTVEYPFLNQTISLCLSPGSTVISLGMGNGLWNQGCLPAWHTQWETTQLSEKTIAQKQPCHRLHITVPQSMDPKAISWNILDILFLNSLELLAQKTATPVHIFIQNTETLHAKQRENWLFLLDFKENLQKIHGMPIGF